MKILHITSWYPTNKNPKSALWIQRHIMALAYAGTENKIYHLELNNGSFELSLGDTELNGNQKYSLITTFLPWFVKEIVAAIFLFWIVWKERKRHYNIINFHIAYPNLTYWHWIKRWVKTPLVITEHWSSYHDNFGLDSADQLPRIQNIFRQKIWIIAVSNALLNDIRIFSSTEIQGFMVPNVVETTIFHYKREVKPESHRFFMVSQWKNPKDPFTVIKSFAKYVEAHPKAELRIGGYGPQIKEMRELIKSLQLEQNITWLGTLHSAEIAMEMNRAAAFIHFSGYETFSVVCAEAVCCGCPVIANRVGGIPEFINERNGKLVSSSKDLLNAMLELGEKGSVDRLKNSQKITKKFSLETIGKQYVEVLKTIINQ